jgi:hypothetical protein
MIVNNVLKNTRKCLCVQYSQTNVMHFSFSLLRIKDLYMFRALFAHPQEAHKRRLVYCVRVMSVDCSTVAVNLVHEKCIALVAVYWYTMMHSQLNISLAVPYFEIVLRLF